MHKTPEITRLIHDNFWIVLSFAFGQPAVAQIVEQQFQGEWKYLNKTIHETAEIRADRALLELATQLRVLDDEQRLSSILKQIESPAYGEVVQKDDTRTPLHFRDMTNKIMHGAAFDWELGSNDPKVIIHSNQPDRWKRAELSIISMMALIGGLMY